MPCLLRVQLLWLARGAFCFFPSTLSYCLFFRIKGFEMCMCKPNKANYAQRITVEQNIEIYKVSFIGYKNDNIIIYKGKQWCYTRRCSKYVSIMFFSHFPLQNPDSHNSLWEIKQIMKCDSLMWPLHSHVVILRILLVHRPKQELIC